MGVSTNAANETITPLNNSGYDDNPIPTPPPGIALGIQKDLTDGI